MKQLLFLFWVMLLSNMHSQTNNESQFMPISSFEQYNERGFQNSSSLGISGNEIISDFNGNMSIVYSMPVQLPGNLGGDLTLVYNGNVEHRFFIGPNLDWVNYSGYPINSSEWIIGYKGIALQTFNFEGKFYSQNIDEITNLTGEQIPLHIPGYSYTNQIWDNETSLPPDTPLKYDVIEILKSDGSKISLVNKNHTVRTGTYFESNFESNGYAVVQEYDLVNKLRKMWYKKGDGLTYYI